MEEISNPNSMPPMVAMIARKYTLSTQHSQHASAWNAADETSLKASVQILGKVGSPMLLVCRALLPETFGRGSMTTGRTCFGVTGHIYVGVNHTRESYPFAGIPPSCKYSAEG